MTTVDLARSGMRGALRVDRVWMVIVLALAVLAVAAPTAWLEVVGIASAALANTAPYLLFAVLAIAYMKATGSERLVASAFQGNESRMIVLAAVVGAFAPFCSCEIIPFIAALLMVGTPLSAVMALWLSSPLMDPSIMLITAGALGWSFAIFKMAVAVALGVAGGFVVKSLVGAGHFQDILLERKSGGCCSAKKPFKGAPVWSFWREGERRAVFGEQAMSNGLFLLKWLALAYLIEGLMIRYVPAETIAGVVGGQGLLPIVVSTLIGIPAYLNGYAAPAIVSGLVDHGMSQGSAMAFVIAGGVTSIPAATAVFAIVKRPVFITYLALGISGAILSGVAFDLFVSMV